MTTMRTSDVTMFSGPGLRLSGRVYHPAEDRDRHAGIVFCHGFGGVKEGTPVGLSEILAQHGYTVLTFDYRGFGGSEGPRGRLVPAEQVEDAVHAVEYLASLPGVDRRRLGIYGTSFGGGIAALAALRSEHIRAAIVTVPVTSGGQWLRSITRHYEFLTLKQRAYAAIAHKAKSGEMEMVDRFEVMLPDPLSRERFGQQPFPMAMETFFHVLHHEPISEAARIAVPTFVIGVRGDPLVPVEQAIEFHDRLACKKALSLHEGDNHYVVYEGLLAKVGRCVKPEGT